MIETVNVLANPDDMCFSSGMRHLLVLQGVAVSDSVHDD
jgi:hypothetical protein